MFWLLLFFSTLLSQACPATASARIENDFPVVWAHAMHQHKSSQTSWVLAVSCASEHLRVSTLWLYCDLKSWLFLTRFLLHFFRGVGQGNKLCNFAAAAVSSNVLVPPGVFWERDRVVIWEFVHTCRCRCKYTNLFIKENTIKCNQNGYKSCPKCSQNRDTELIIWLHIVIIAYLWHGGAKVSVPMQRIDDTRLM